MSSAITPRQAEVLQLLAAGLRVKEIARRLRINPRTAQGHLAAMRRSLGVASNPHLVAIAVGRGLLPHPGAQAVRGEVRDESRLSTRGALYKTPGAFQLHGRQPMSPPQARYPAATRWIAAARPPAHRASRLPSPARSPAATAPPAASIP